MSGDGEDLGIALEAQENTVFYEMYPSSRGANAADLDALLARALDEVVGHMDGYVWQRDALSLHNSFQAAAPWHVHMSSAKDGKPKLPNRPPCLWGSTCFGDNIEDEWFIVWLLQQLTRVCPGTTARVWDNDGDFILIEAAYALPAWLKPETAVNRVWIHGGALHVIPLTNKRQPTLPPVPGVADALEIVRAEGVETLAPSGVSAALARRIAGYPAQARKNMHRARALVPAKVAHLLARERQLVAPAVEAFHQRDVDDMKAAAAMASFPPQDMVSVLVTMNRCQYAQLVQLEFAAPRNFPMPIPASPTFRAADLGMRLTCGFEMMYANRARFGAGVYEAAMDTDEEPLGAAEPAGAPAPQSVARNPAWAPFRASLDTVGYFEGEIPGSAVYKQLLGAAIERFMRTNAYRRAAASLAAPALRVDELLREAYDPSALEQAGQGAEDSTEWMLSGAAELEAEMRRRAAELEGDVAGKKGAGTGAFNPQKLADRMKAFVEKGKGGLEGAEEPLFGGDGPIALDDQKFFDEIRTALDLPADGNLGLDDSLFSDDDIWGEDGDDDEDDGGDEEGESDDGNHPITGNGSAASPLFKGELLSVSGIFKSVQEKARELTPAAVIAAAGGPTAAGPEGNPAPHPFKGGRAGPPPSRAEPCSPAAADGGGPGGGETSGVGDGGAARAEDGEWDARTATDSDDEGRFDEGYAEAMDVELQGTAMGKTFERLPADKAAAAQDSDDDLAPVDVDYNLVHSMLTSFSNQRGMPGPASNLAGLLGIPMPFDEE